MSTIEPTDITRTMRCTSCNAVGAHTIDASMRNEAVLCPACAESGKRSACVVVNPNEPTEEQKQAAREWIALDLDMRYGVDHVAMLLAEREAKLREEYQAPTQDVVIGQLRERVAELTERSARRLDDSTAIDALVYAIACLELQPGNERDRAVRDALNRVINHVGAIEVRARDSATKVVGTLVAGAKAREDALTARVAELEAKAANLDARLWDRCEDLARVGLERVHADAVHSKREAQHLARIAELEAKANEACRWCAEEDYCDCLGCGGRLPVVCVVGGKCARCSKAQHLADIKAAKEKLVDTQRAIRGGLDVYAEDFDELLARLAHYDDAKAAEGGEG